MIITHGRSHRRWVFTSDSKAVLGTKLVQWAKQIKTKHGLRLVAIRCDDAREILNARNQAYFDEESVTIEPSPPYEPNRNGMAERTNGITETRVRAALIAAGLPESL